MANGKGVAVAVSVEMASEVGRGCAAVGVKMKSDRVRSSWMNEAMSVGTLGRRNSLKMVAMTKPKANEAMASP